MVCTQKNFDKLASAYSEVLLQTLRLHNVCEVWCECENPHFFDHIVLNDGGMLVYNHGLKTPWKGLFFDFTVDYAKCLGNIEEDLYLASHHAQPKNGMIFKFNS